MFQSPYPLAYPALNPELSSQGAGLPFLKGSSQYNPDILVSLLSLLSLLTHPAKAEMKYKTRKLQALLAAQGGNMRGHRNLGKCLSCSQTALPQLASGGGALR